MAELMQQLANSLSKLSLEVELIQEIYEIGFSKSYESGQVILDQTSMDGYIPFVMEGLLKVYRKESDDREVLLYYLEQGETCAMSITCCLEKRNASIKVIAEENSKIWFVPNELLNSWITKYPSFRAFVFRSYQTRFDELLDTIDSMVFFNMEERLFKYLLDTKQATGNFEIQKTHKEIANELGTSRVVVSRLLKKLEQEEKIKQYRNRIDIL
ncbi:Crp/Fnr family transcriptional regulator [Ekhidna sp.]|uniref:Crp/Fnr family transcriptional regulator n=1 Tax=Ekhidna sp. TaxID=2608089 RepID=UPI003B5075F1